MNLVDLCPECGSTLLGSMRCACGWVMSVKHETDGIDQHCQFVEEGHPCDNRGTICPKGSKQWFCGKHWYRAIYSKCY